MFRQLTESVRSVGVADTNLERFENQYPLTDGVTYNSYVISDGGKTVVIDSVDHRRGAEWLQRVAAAAPDGVDYLVIQHMEPDHSSSLMEFARRYPRAVLVGSAAAVKMLGQFFPDCGLQGRTMTVADGSSLSIGSHELVFMTAPMVHWPEVINTYDRTDRTLFTADAFGTFGTCDNVATLWPSEARRYYCNIVGKYGPQVQRLLAKAAALNPAPERLCPLHGPVLEGAEMSRGCELYNLWSCYKPEEPEGVLVAYASIYGNTARAALWLAAELERRGATVVTIDLCSQHVSEAVAQAFRMGRIVAAAPTYDAGLFPPMYDFLHHLTIKNLRDRRFGLVENGSWAPAAGKVMTEMISTLKGAEIAGPLVSVRSAMTDTTRTDLEALAAAMLS